MTYECKMVPIDRAILDPRGFVRPRCDTCANPDCSNPIKDITLSIMGVPTKMRLYHYGDYYRLVVDCPGFISNLDVDDDEDIAAEVPSNAVL